MNGSATAGTVGANHALEVVDRQLFIRSDLLCSASSEIDGIDIHMAGNNGAKLLYQTREDVDYATGDVARCKHFGEADSCEWIAFVCHHNNCVALHNRRGDCPCQSEQRRIRALRRKNGNNAHWLGHREVEIWRSNGVG